MKKLYAVTMGPDYKGPAERVAGLPGGRRKRMSRFAKKGEPDYAYAEFSGDDETATRLARETGLTVKAISKTALPEHPFASPAVPVSDEEVEATKSKKKAAKGDK